MTESTETTKKPLWLSIEENLLGLGSQDLSGENLESAIQTVAGQLDGAGYNVSKDGGNMLELRWAMQDMVSVGHPMLKDFNTMVEAFKLEDVMDAYAATGKLIDDLGETWPKLKLAARRPDVIGIVENTKLGLLVAKAKGMEGDQGIRLLIAEKVEPGQIIDSMGITQEKLDQVNEAIKQEKAERDRVAGLLEAVADKSDAEKVKHLFENNVTEELIMEMAGVSQDAITDAKKAMEEEIKEKERQAAEAAAKKKAEAEGPALDDIPADEMLDHIEAIREIMEFSDQEKEIRVMCEQSSLPKALVDIAVSDPAKLDELEKKAEG